MTQAGAADPATLAGRRICVFGIGAIGGSVAARLAHIAEDASITLSLVARGGQYDALKANGIRYSGPDALQVAMPVAVTDDPGSLPAQDLVFCCLKAHQQPAAAAALAGLLAPEGRVVFVCNGIPWWYLHGLDPLPGSVNPGGADPGDPEARRLPLLDPDGVLWREVGPERAIGCVAYPAASVPEPGVIRHGAELRMILGLPGGGSAPQLDLAAAALVAAGFEAMVSDRIRDAIWVKLLGNITFNPVSMLTLGTFTELTGNPELRALLSRMMTEAIAIGEALGTRFDVDVERRIAMAEPLGDMKTSTLQDLEAGRQPELDALVGAAVALADRVGVPAPTIRAILALSRARARAMLKTA